MTVLCEVCGICPEDERKFWGETQSLVDSLKQGFGCFASNEVEYEFNQAYNADDIHLSLTYLKGNPNCTRKAYFELHANDYIEQCFQTIDSSNPRGNHRVKNSAGWMGMA